MRGPLSVEQMSLSRLRDVSLWRGVQRELGLSPRELEVAIRIVLGDTVRETAARLGLRPLTVKTYLARVHRKAHAANRAELILKLLANSGMLLGE
jgi:DNA-binding CsgD family transcriptional regulator